MAWEFDARRAARDGRDLGEAGGFGRVREFTGTAAATFMTEALAPPPQTQPAAEKQPTTDKTSLITGSEAIAVACKLADVDVITAYPIRPYDTVMRSGWSTVFIVSAVLNFFAAFLALLVLKPMRQRAMAEELFPDALGITRV